MDFQPSKKHAQVIANFLKLSKRITITDITLDESTAINQVLEYMFKLMKYCEALPEVVVEAPKKKLKKKKKR